MKTFPLQDTSLIKRKHTLFVMTVSMGLGYMPWYNFSAVLKYIADEFSLTASDTGWVIAAFQAGYVLAVGATGWLGDKVSLKKILFWGTLMTGVFSTLFVWGVHGKLSIILFRLMTGLSAGAIYVPGLTLLSRWFPSTERGSALGAYTGAMVAAYAGGYLIAGRLAAAHGWRIGVLWTSIPALLAALLIQFFLRDMPPEEGRKAGDSAVVLETGFKPNLSSGLEDNEDELSGKLQSASQGYKGLVLISVGYMGHMWELYSFWGWVGPFLLSALIGSGMSTDMAVKCSGTISAIIILLGAPSSWLWGIFADRKGRTRAIIIAGCFSIGAEFFFGYLYGHSLMMLVLVGAWIGFWGIADSAVYKAALTEMVPSKIRGTCLGIQSVIGFFVTIISSVVFGRILNKYNGPADASSAKIWGPAFFVLGVGGVLAPLAALILHHQRKRRLMEGGKANDDHSSVW